MPEFHVGCCGFPVSRQSYYRSFDAVEIQQTFYHPPRIQTAQRWRQEAPESFSFTIKAWQLITHDPTSPTYRRLRLKIGSNREKNYGSFNPTDEVFAAWQTSFDFARALGARIVLFQCPASFKPEAHNKKNMRGFFRFIKREGLILAWEPRGSWQKEEIKELCEEFNLIHCVDPLKATPVYGELRYFRLHGPSGYRSRYNSHHLSKLRRLCRGKTYYFFNNSSMFQDALEFLNQLKA